MRNPCISIIVPVYNVEEYIRQCIDSILAQTFEDFELILIDDGSQDRCGEICDEYALRDVRVHVIHQENQGLSAARNTALDMMRGRYCAFIDSDDCILNDYLEKLYNCIMNENADISLCNYISFSNEDIKKFENLNTEEFTYKVVSGKDASLLRYAGEIHITACGKLISKRLLESVRFPVGEIYEDQAVIPLLLYQSSKVCICKEQLYLYRIRKGSITNSKFSVRNFDNIKHMNTFISYLEEKLEEELVSRAKKHREKTLAEYIIRAQIAGITEIPNECYMSELKAFSVLRKIWSDDKYCWYLSKLHPYWIRPHQYIRKIEKILKGIADENCNNNLADL